jgi:aryl-alcohol dehydrogenase
MKIKAAVLVKANAEFTFTELDLAEPRAHEVRVKIKACGICHTDIFMRKSTGSCPYVLGHEISGVVEKTGRNVSRLKPGDHVALAYTSCGTCAACKAGRNWECVHFSDNFSGCREDGTTPLSLNGKPVVPLMREGGFAEYTVCHENAVTKLDKKLDLRVLAPLGCGIMTGAGSVFNYLKPEKGKAIGVFGAGPVGLSAIMAAKIAGCDPIIAVDRLPSRLKMAAALGASHCIDSGKRRIGETITAVSGGLDYAFDTSGNGVLLEALGKALNAGAKACGVGIGGELALSAAEIRDGKSWESTDAGFAVPQVFIPRLVSLYKKGLFPFDRMIRFYPFSRINEAFRASEAGTVIKPVLLME